MEGDDDSHHFTDTQPGLIAFRLAIAWQPGDSPFTEPLKLAVEVVNVAEDLGQGEAR